MDDNSGTHRGVTRRKTASNLTFCIKKERDTKYRKVYVAVQKNESDRTEEENELLRNNDDLVQKAVTSQKKREEVKARSEEVEDPEDVLLSKCAELALALRSSSRLVVYTGAGISTAAKIPDYRGTNGIWTLMQQGKDIGNHDLSQAEPTLTHMALFELYSRGILKYVVSQNCDGLHLRSGLPRNAVSEVHGNMHLEVCRECKPEVQYWRTFDVTENTARFSHRTMRRCHVCHSALIDTIVHFGERGNLPWPLNWPAACKAAETADTILCMGSSLKVLKKYPWLWGMDRPAKKRPKLYIINLQWTPKDDHAALKINGRCDRVMQEVMKCLQIPVPPYNRFRDPIFWHATHLHTGEEHTLTQPQLDCPYKMQMELQVGTSVNDNPQVSGIKRENVGSGDIIECPPKIRKEETAFLNSDTLACSFWKTENDFKPNNEFLNVDFKHKVERTIEPNCQSSSAAYENLSERSIHEYRDYTNFSQPGFVSPEVSVHDSEMLRRNSNYTASPEEFNQYFAQSIVNSFSSLSADNNVYLNGFVRQSENSHCSGSNFMGNVALGAMMIEGPSGNHLANYSNYSAFVKNGENVLSDVLGESGSSYLGTRDEPIVTSVSNPKTVISSVPNPKTVICPKVSYQHGSFFVEGKENVNVLSLTSDSNKVCGPEKIDAKVEVETSKSPESETMLSNHVMQNGISKTDSEIYLCDTAKDTGIQRNKTTKTILNLPCGDGVSKDGGVLKMLQVEHSYSKAVVGEENGTTISQLKEEDKDDSKEQLRTSSRVREKQDAQARAERSASTEEAIVANTKPAKKREKPKKNNKNRKLTSADFEMRPELRARTCTFCLQYYFSPLCLFYPSLDSHPRKFEGCICECCDYSSESEEEEEEEEEEEGSAGELVDIKDEITEEESAKAVINPGWYGKGYRKRIRKRK